MSLAMVRRAHHIDRLAELGVVRLSGTLNMEDRNIQGTFETRPSTPLGDGSKARLGGGEEVVVLNDGRVWHSATTMGTTELEGVRREQALLDQFSVRFGDWTRNFEPWTCSSG